MCGTNLYKRMKYKQKKGLTSRQMSKLYKTLRKKGLNKKKAFKITGKAKINSKAKYLKKIDPYGNFDGDNKVNKYDCKPLNKWKQDDKDFVEGYEDGIIGINIMNDIPKDNTPTQRYSDYMKGQEQAHQHINKYDWAKERKIKPKE